MLYGEESMFYLGQVYSSLELREGELESLVQVSITQVCQRAKYMFAFSRNQQNKGLQVTCLTLDISLLHADSMSLSVNQE
jgi:hypothetical protein